MSYLRDGHPGAISTVSVSLWEIFGFMPSLFRAQALLPRIVEAETSLASAVLVRGSALSRLHKESVILAVAAAYRNEYCTGWYGHSLRARGIAARQIDQVMINHRHAGLSTSETTLLDYVVKLATRAPWLSGEDIAMLRVHGFTDAAILEAILATGLTNFFCTLAAGLGVTPDFESPAILPNVGAPLRETKPYVGGTTGPHLTSVDLAPESFPPILLERFGSIPNLFRAQTLLPDAIAAQADLVANFLQPEDALSRMQKECILAVGSAANLNTYCVAAHCEMLRVAGRTSMMEADRIAVDHHQADLSSATKALLDFVLKLTVRPSEIRREDIEALRRDDFGDEQILEAVAVTALNNFFNTLQMGLGTKPDVEPVRTFGPQDSHRSVSSYSPSENPAIDPDSELVARVQDGDLDAFEELIGRHSRRVYRALLAIVGNVEDAKDAMQDTFLKAFQHIGRFQRRSKFSTWLVKIASNTGLQRLRERGRFESLDDDPGGDEGFRPRQVRAWDDDPETMYSHAERRRLVESGLMTLPAKYRVVLVLRDIEQLSTEEAANALGLGIPALKARLLRGRLMLRDALSPSFAASAERIAL
jgi:RNA polymerase sigma-70 factor (ECF subfamily)